MFRIRKETAVQPQGDTRVIKGGRWKCDDCGRYIQQGMSRGDHNLISHRFGDIGRR